jgi:hypothetical protein
MGASREAPGLDRRRGRLSARPRKHLRISPSQVKRFHQCPRRTAWQLNSDVERESDPLPRANDLGTRCHTIAEEWLRDGTPPDRAEAFRYWRRVQQPARHAPEVRPCADHAVSGAWDEATDAYPGAIFSEGIPHLPAPKSPGLVTEAESVFILPDGIIFAARGDFKDTGADGVPRIGDHKFLRDLSYGLTDTPGSVNSFGEPSYLGDDPQALIQAAAELVRDPKIPGVDLTWVNYQTKPKGGRLRAKRVHVRVLPDEIRAGIRPVIQTARVIQDLFDSELDPRLFPANAQSCGAFGRPCEHVARCNLTDQERFDSLMQDHSPPAVDARVAALLASLQTGAIAPTVQGQAPPPPPPPPPPPREGTYAPPMSINVPDLPRQRVIPPPQPPMAHTPAGAPLGPQVHYQIQPPPPPPPPPPAYAPIQPTDDLTAIRAATAAAHGRAPADPINPPECPPMTAPIPVAPAARVDAVQVPSAGYAAMDRDALKALAVERKILTSGSRHGAVAIREMLEADDRAHVSLPAGVVDGPIPAAAAAMVNASPADALRPNDRHGQVDRAPELRAALDAINGARRALDAAETALHAALGIA